MSSYTNSNLNSYDEITLKSDTTNIENDINSLNENDIAFYLFDEHEDNL